MLNRQYRLISHLDSVLGRAFYRYLKPNLNPVFSREQIIASFKKEIPIPYRLINSECYNTLFEELESCKDNNLAYLLATSRNKLAEIKKIELSPYQEVMFLLEEMKYKQEEKKRIIEFISSTYYN